MKYRPIMTQGTASSVGKSLIVAGLCRLLSNKGIKVAPFKAQNMSLNSGVVENEFEIGRAQILQAEASRVKPDARMNPILIKPTKEGYSQIIRMGKPFKVVSYKEYYTYYEEHLKIVKSALESLLNDYEMIVIEGAGSPAEINLQRYDLVNMKTAQIANANVYIVGDIDRGGVFAAFKGTYDLVQDEYKNYIKGFIINKFRGDMELLKPGIEQFKRYCNVPIKGVLPYFEHHLEEEDSQNICFKSSPNEAKLKIGVIKLKYLSNFTDFSPLEAMNEIYVEYLKNPAMVEEFDLIVIPGSKNTMKDLEFLKTSGFFDALKKIYGKKPIMGICSGFQMLGSKIIDNMGVESKGVENGLGFIEMKTFMLKDKVLTKKSYKPSGLLKGSITGYEIHHGKTQITDERFVDLLENKGLLVYDKKNRVIGTYLHGIFENSSFLNFLFSILGVNLRINKTYSELKENSLNKLAELIEENLWENIKDDL